MTHRKPAKNRRFVQSEQFGDGRMKYHDSLMDVCFQEVQEAGRT
jgi:hypothetical protein